MYYVSVTWFSMSCHSLTLNISQTATHTAKLSYYRRRTGNRHDNIQSPITQLIVSRVFTTKNECELICSLSHCGACRRKWRRTDTDLCPCGETQTMPHSVESCPLTKLNDGLSRLHSVDEDAVSWLTSYS